MPDYTPQPQEVQNHFHLVSTSSRAGFMSAADKVLLDSLAASAAIWGSISGTITNQTDLVNYVATQIAGKANTASPTFTGTPAAPTASPGTNTTQIATTAFVTAAVAAGGGGYIDGEVDVYADLPVTTPNPPLDSAYIVRDSSGLWLVNYHPAGIYIRTALGGVPTDWTYAGAFPDAFSDANFEIYDNVDATKLLSFVLGGATTGKRMQFASSHTDNRVITFPDATCTLLYSGGALGTPASGNASNLTNFPTLNQNTTGSAASLSVAGQTGLVTITGITSTNRAKTVRDAADTILELGGSYTPTGTWTNLTLVTPALGTPSALVLSAGVSGILPDACMPNLTGDVTTTEGAVATTIANNAVTNAKSADMAVNTIKGRITGSTGDPEDLTVLQAQTVLNPLTINTQTDNYTLVLADAGKLVQMNKATANTLTVPKNSAVAYPTGTTILCGQIGAGLTTVSPVDGDVTINSRGAALKSGGQYAQWTLVKRDTDVWVMTGDITA